MNIVIIGDVGREPHTGDDAMFEVALGELAARGADSFTVIAPRDIHGVPFEVARVSPIGFGELPGSAHDDERERRLEDVLSLTIADVQISQVVQAVRAADAVVVAGGGNLSASWPHHLYERAALLEIAARHGVPAIVTGQTIGPVLTLRQRSRLGHALASARFIGVRDVPSLALARELGAASNAVLQVDDAITLAEGVVDEALPTEYVALSAHQFDVDRARVARDIAALVSDLHRGSGLPVVIFPNTEADSQLANEVKAVVLDDKVISVASLTTATATANGIRRSAAVVSMRFHPLVFALAAGVPCMAITSDSYTGVKLEGALQHAGLASWQVPTDALATPIVAELFTELWARRTEIRAHLLATTPQWFDDHRRRWDAIWSTIKGDGAAVTALVDAPPREIVKLHPRTAAAPWSTALSAAARERLALAEHRIDTAEESAFSLHRTLRSREEEIQNFHIYVDALEARLTSLEAELGSRKRRD